MKWKNLFEEHILHRGYEYYRNGAVEILDEEEDIVTAKVIGSECYDVEIYLDDEADVEDMYCSCPYAENGCNCKHMAAVLYTWSEDKVQNEDAEDREDMEESEDYEESNSSYDTVMVEYQKKQKAIRKLVAEADESSVREFLASILEENETLLLRFSNIVNGHNRKVVQENVGKYIARIDQIAEECLGRNRFISYYEADDFIERLDEILDNDVRRMIDDGNYMSAFAVMNHIFALPGNVDMDDSDGGSGMLADNVYKLWSEILSKVSAKEKRQMFQWFTSHLDGSIIDYLEEFIENFLMENFKEKEYEKDKLAFVAGMIRQSEKKASGWSREYAMGKWLQRYLSLLEEQKATDTEIEKVCEEYWKFSKVRAYSLERCMARKDYGKALKILDESIKKDKNYPGLVAGYQKKKKEIYRMQGNRDAYVKQLWTLLLHHDSDNLELYKELKAQYTPEEWLEKREEVFHGLPPYAKKDQLYLEEQLYDRLLDYVLKQSGLYALQKYENVLYLKYPEQILEKYRKEVNEMAEPTTNRKQYAELVSLLREMQDIPGGKAVVAEIVRDWKANYRNRRAMMEELRALDAVR